MHRLILYDDEAKVYSDEFEGTVVIGRADSDRHEPPPFTRLKLDDDTRVKLKLPSGAWKVVFASSDETVWSRNQVIFEPSPGGAKIKVTNGGSQRFFVLEGGRKILPGESCEAPLPAVVNLGGSRVVRVQTVGAPGFLPNVTLPPPSRGAPPQVPTLAGLPSGINQKEVIAWLNAATDVLQAAVSSDEFFDRAVAGAVQMIDLDSARLLLYKADDWQPKAAKHAGQRVAAEGWTPSQRVLNQLLKEKRTVWDVLDAGQDGNSLHGVDAVIAAPVLDQKGQVIGALYGERRRAVSMLSPPITEAEAMLVELLARGVAAGLARQKQERAAVALQSELDIGRQIQRGFLPTSLPQLANWEIGTKFQPAKEVSGDFYDVFKLSENHVGLIIADVCNKGLGAALFMALFRSLLRAFSQQGIARDLTGSLVNQQLACSPQGDRNLVTLLIELNALTTVALTNNYVANMHGEACMFVTLFLGVLDTTTGIVHYVNAGHDPPIHLGPSGIKGRLQPTGPVVGIMPDQCYNLQTVSLEPGDLLFCYTDGVIDARSPNGTRFTDKHLLELLNQPFTSAAQVLNLVETKVNTHAANLDPFDDIAMLAVYRMPAAGQN